MKDAGKTDRLDRVQRIADLNDIYYIRQKERNGLDDAITYAKNHVGDEPFALLLGDIIIESETSCTRRLIEHAERHEESVISLERVPWERVEAYGVAQLENADLDDLPDSFPVEDFVEKPSQTEAPSNFAITGRYILEPEIFDALEKTEPGMGGELQLTDVIRQLDAVRGVELRGDRYDIGNIPDWLQANIEMVLHHDDGELNNAVRDLLAEDYDGP